MGERGGEKRGNGVALRILHACSAHTAVRGDCGAVQDLQLGGIKAERIISPTPQPKHFGLPCRQKKSQLGNGSVWRRLLMPSYKRFLDARRKAQTANGRHGNPRQGAATTSQSLANVPSESILDQDSVSVCSNTLAINGNCNTAGRSIGSQGLDEGIFSSKTAANYR